MSENLRQLVTKSLLAGGWSDFDERGKSLSAKPVNWSEASVKGIWLAIKDYKTEVGIKTATVHIEDYGLDYDNFRLLGHYQSEGRNILEPHSVLIPKTLPEGDMLTRLIAEFVADTEATIDASYARKLWLTRPVSAN